MLARGVTAKTFAILARVDHTPRTAHMVQTTLPYMVATCDKVIITVHTTYRGMQVCRTPPQLTPRTPPEERAQSGWGRVWGEGAG